MVRLLALSLVLLGAAGSQPARPFSPVSAAEFPPNDPLFSLASRSKLAQLASDAARREPQAPETVRLLARAEDFDRMLQVMRRIVDRAPERIADAFVAASDALWRFRGDDEQARRRRETLRQIVIDARKRLLGLSPEEAARAERLFITTDQVAADQEFSRDRNNWIHTLQQFVEKYATSEAALLTRVEILSDGRATEAQFQALEAFARQHAGTTAAARAIYEIGFDLHTINTLGTIEQRGSDPIHRFERVMAIARELESGRYPKSEWVDKAPSLVFQFFIPRDATFAPESVERMIAMLTDYAKSHLDLREDHPASNSVIYTLTTTLADLFEKRGERTAGVERVLMDIEKTAAEPDALRYLRGLLFVQERYRQRGVDVAALMRKALDVLTPLAEEGTGLYNRKALATIGMLHLGEGDCANALKALRRYASSYPDSDWRWIALLRAGQCEESLSDFKAAADTYIQIANEHGELSVARLLATEYAARAFEALGELPRALALHRQALDGWEPTMYAHISAPIPRRPTNEIPDLTRRDPSTIQKDALSARIAEIEHTLAMPGGAELERGRWLLASGRYDDAISEMRSLTQKHASSSAAAHARELSHRAQLMKALQLANLERPGNDRAAAKTALDALGREPLDFSVVASRIARASLLWVDGDGGAAEGVMRDALDAWHAQQRPSTPAPGIEQELAAIRRAVFLPGGGGVYRSGRWDPPWPTPPPPFCFVNTDVPVKDHDGKVMRVSLILDFDAQRIVFFNTDQIAVLKDILVQLGGTRRREPGHIMETPNQPVGDSMQILKLWSKFFVARPGHWGGWDLETAPVITEIEFTNAERTKASARVTIGYTGGTVELEKEDGRWIAKRLTNQWIT